MLSLNSAGKVKVFYRVFSPVFVVKLSGGRVKKLPARLTWKLHLLQRQPQTMSLAR